MPSVFSGQHLRQRSPQKKIILHLVPPGAQSRSLSAPLSESNVRAATPILFWVWEKYISPFSSISHHSYTPWSFARRQQKLVHFSLLQVPFLFTPIPTEQLCTDYYYYYYQQQTTICNFIFQWIFRNECSQQHCPLSTCIHVAQRATPWKNIFAVNTIEIHFVEVFICLIFVSWNKSLL